MQNAARRTLPHRRRKREVRWHETGEASDKIENLKCNISRIITIIATNVIVACILN